MRKIAIFLLTVVAVMMLSCRGRKHDMAFYERQIDSIRKAEQLKQLEKKTGLNGDPVRAWFDTLHLRPLPIETAGADVDRITRFTPVPVRVNGCFGYDENARLKAAMLPACHGHRVVLLCEMKDSITPSLSLYTLDRDLNPIDILTLYEQNAEERDGLPGMSYNEYFITSRYEIMVMDYFRTKENPTKPRLESTRAYLINRDGEFEEQVIML